MDNAIAPHQAPPILSSLSPQAHRLPESKAG